MLFRPITSKVVVTSNRQNQTKREIQQQEEILSNKLRIKSSNDIKNKISLEDSSLYSIGVKNDVYVIAKNLLLSDIQKFEVKITNYINSKNYLLEKIKNQKQYILNFDNIDIDNITKVKQINYDPNNTPLRFVNICHQLAKINNNIANCTEKIKLLQKDIEILFADIDKFNTVLKYWNRFIRREIVKGYNIYFGYGIGQLFLKRYLTKPDSGLNDGNVTSRSFIDWAASKKLKAEIIARGGKPFEAIRDEDGKKIGDNGGEKYLVIKPQSERYYIHWQKSSPYGNANYDMYTFVPADKWVREYIRAIREDNSLIDNLKTVG